MVEREQFWNCSYKLFKSEIRFGCGTEDDSSILAEAKNKSKVQTKTFNYSSTTKVKKLRVKEIPGLWTTGGNWEGWGGERVKCTGHPWKCELLISNSYLVVILIGKNSSKHSLFAHIHVRCFTLQETLLIKVGGQLPADLWEAI